MISREEWPEFEVWLGNGISRGWIARPSCLTHDRLETTAEEEEEMDEGYDPCMVVARVWV